MAVTLGAAVAVAACESGPTSGFESDSPQVGAANPDGGTAELGGEAGSLGSVMNVTSISIDPPNATLESNDGAAATQSFKLLGHFENGTTGTLNGVVWSAGSPQVGAIADSGVFTASGSTGGLVKLNASYKGQTVSASLTVKLHLHQGANIPSATVKDALAAATTKDPAVVWAYPYDGTVFPRGLAAPPLMWNGGAAKDIVSVHVTSPTFELEAYQTIEKVGTYPFVAADWQRFVDSTSGAAKVTVTRWNGTAATVLADHTWNVAPGSMRGTIYYWAQNIGRVVRIKPGADKPDDFANVAPLNDTGKFPASGCLMTCHTVSSDGSTIVSGGGSFGGSYSLTKGEPMFSLGGVWGGGANGSVTNARNIEWSNAALTPNGKYVVENQLASQLSQAVSGPAVGGMFRTADGTPVANAGLPSDPVFMPAFSPDASKLVYVSGVRSVPANWITNAQPGALRVMDFDANKSPMLSNARDLIQPGANPMYNNITWPTVTPDGGWALYTRSNGTNIDSRGNCTAAGCDFAVRGDLFMADATKPNSEVRLAALNGDGYPFAAGARDLHFNYEPTFAPVASGGYFWVVFTSRRTYGNRIVGGPASAKQLWVAAIDQNPTPGKDPSHPAFRLSGQAEDTLNLRGFWALDPCKGDGQGCGSGTECCGGYCDGASDGGAPVCKSQAPACSGDGDKCQATSDCCGASNGATCINHVCAEGAPR